MMQTLWNWIIDNYQWLFGGIGAIFLAFVFRQIFRRKKQPAPPPSTNVGGDQFSTSGPYSPGKVEGDYKVDQSTHVHQPPPPPPPKKA